MIDLDEVQLNRIEQAISALEGQPPVERQKRYHLLRALETERQELLKCHRSASWRVPRRVPYPVLHS